MRHRILSITSNFPRWPEDSTTPFVLNIAKDLVALGWGVDVLAPHAQGALTWEAMEGVRVHRFHYLWPASLETVCYQGGALINLRQDKTNYLKLPFLVGAQWLHSMRHILSRNYDILHTHWILPQGFNGVLVSKTLKIPHVLTVHGGDVFGLQRQPFTLLKRRTLLNADAVTVNSSVTERAVLQLAPRAKSVRRIPMGVTVPHQHNFDLIDTIRKKYRKGNGPLLAFVGRVVDEKGVGDLIRAIEKISHQKNDVSAVIVGEGQDRLALEALSQALNLSDRIFFLGWIKPELVGDYLAAADIFIGPSRRATDGWIEAQGLTFIEAMVAKTPVVATRVGGIVDSVIDEKTGLLVSERSPGEIADAVIKVMENKSLRESLVVNGYNLAISYFSRQQTARAFDGLFKSLMAQR